MAAARPGQLEGVPHHPVATATGKDRLLCSHLGIGITIKTSTDFGVLTFVVLADDAEVNALVVGAFQGGIDSAKTTRGAQVDILLRGSADRNE